jgi:glycosyltransferase involved in cell wall biosynthesis
MRVLFLSHYFPPEVNAPAARTYEHCRRWAAAGHDVTVLTCVPNCPDGVPFAGYRNRLRRQVEMIDGVRVVRVWTHLAANRGTFRRTANFVSYLASAGVASLRLPRPDVVIATSPQFFCGWAGVLVSRLKRVPFILEIRDIWPESIEAVGALRNRPLLRALTNLERRMYLAADHIVTVGEGYRTNILGKVNVADRIDVITNGVDPDSFRPRDRDLRFRHHWDLEGKFVVSYVGTIGMAHGLEVVLEAARQLRARGRDDIRFCLVGDGAARADLEEQARRDGLDHLVRFTGRLPREQMPDVMAASDACLVHLRGKELFNTVIPSKIFEAMAMGRPIIMGVRGEARDIVLRAEAGIEMEPDCPHSLLAAVEALADQPALASELGRSARDFVLEHYNRDRLAERYLELLHSVCGAQNRRSTPVTEPLLSGNAPPTVPHREPSHAEATP